MSTLLNREPETEQSKEYIHLTTLLEHKLKNIPPFHLPKLKLLDILDQTPRATHISNIPPDIQLAFLLRNRTQIDQHGTIPVKDETAQPLDTTRAIWYYRLDATHQFQRYHDISRWNLALFLALLSLPTNSAPESTPHSSDLTRRDGTHPFRPALSKDTYIPPAARRFMSSYIAAVLEHHTTPTVFTAREAFIQRWKNGIWDTFCVQAAGCKRTLKAEMKRLGREWEGKLDEARKSMGEVVYAKYVGRFVGCVVPGRKDQGVSAGALWVPEGEREEEEEGGDGDGAEAMEALGGEGNVGNGLLEALRVPLGDGGGQKMMEIEGGIAVVDVRYAIAAMQRMRPSDMLPVLMRMFPPED